MTTAEAKWLCDPAAAPSSSSPCPTCEFIEQLTLAASSSSSNVSSSATNERATNASSSTSLYWHVTDWDDGHIPEGFVEQQQQQQRQASIRQNTTVDDDNHHQQQGCCSGCGFKTRMVQYHHNIRHSNATTRSPVIHVIDHIVPSSLVDALYDETVSLDRPWGTYVTMDQVQDYWNVHGNDTNDDPSWMTTDAVLDQRSQTDLALQAVSYFCRHGLTSDHPTICQTVDPTTTTTTTTNPIVSWPQLLEEAHGVAIWALASSVGSQVPYHLDYAEQIRYDTNVICPPLYAGTLQCSKTTAGNTVIVVNSDDPTRCNDDEDHNSNNNLLDGQDEATSSSSSSSSSFTMKGGDFWVNVGGLDHYRRFGYKGALVSKNEHQDDVVVDEGEKRVSKEADSWLPNVMDSETSSNGSGGSGWVRVPFSYNRIICHQGDLPHCSTKVEALPPNTKRVIVGFNVFPKIVGERVQQAPEHSNAFRRKVQLRRFWLAQQQKQQQQPQVCDDTLPNPSNDDSSNGLGEDAVRAVIKPRGNVFTLNMIQSNKGLTKLFVLAKRQRIQHLFRQAQVKLQKDILQLVLQRQQVQQPSQPPDDSTLQPAPATTVAYLMERLGRVKTVPTIATATTTVTASHPTDEEHTNTPPWPLEDQENNNHLSTLPQVPKSDANNCDDKNDLLRGWPSPLDVQVQVHHMLLLGSDSSLDAPRLVLWQPCHNDDKEESYGIQKKQIVSPATLVCVVTTNSPR